MAKRLTIKEAIKIYEKKGAAGLDVKVSGWVNVRRDHGKIIFIDLRDRSGLLQVVFIPSNKEAYSIAQKLRNEWVVELKGELHKRPSGMGNENIETGNYELLASDAKILAETEGDLPIDISEQNLNVHLDTLLDNRVLTLRNEKIKAIFKIYSELLKSYSDIMRKEDFVEIKTPKILASATEGGANFFKISYFDRNAYLAQSPQFYKQISVGIFERVFEVGSVFRAEPHYTSRHVNEYVGFDAEMGFIKDYTDVMDMLEDVICLMLKNIEKNCQKEIYLYNAETLLIPKAIPRLPLKEVLEILKKEYGKDMEDALDIDAEGEKLIGEYARKQFQSDLLFITHYPISKRPFYTMPDDKDKNLTKSFDLVFRGMEIASGGQRIHIYKDLVAAIESRGLDPKQYGFYLDVFKYGMPPHGGWGLGSERIVKQILGIANVKETILFPRDVKRLIP